MKPGARWPQAGTLGLKYVTKEETSIQCTVIETHTHM